MSFGNPIAWWGLLAIALPFLIHFLSKKKKNLVYIGSLQFLESGDSSSARSFQLSEILLLASRIAAIIGICFLLAQPYIMNDNHGKKIWIEDKIIMTGNHEILVSELENGFNTFTFSSDDLSPEVQYFPSAWTLINKLNESADSAIVYTYGLEKDFKGKKVGLAARHSWNLLPFKEVLNNVDSLITTDSLYFLSTQSDESGINWSIQAAPNNSANTQYSTLSYFITSGINGKVQHHILSKIFDNASAVLPFRFSKTNAIEEADWHFVIDTTIGFIPNQATAYWDSSPSKLELFKIAEKCYNISGKIDYNSLLYSDFGIQLLQTMVKEKLSIDQRNRQIMPPAFISTKLLAGLNNSQNSTHKKPIFILITVLLLVIIERYLSFRTFNNK